MVVVLLHGPFWDICASGRMFPCSGSLPHVLYVVY